MARIAPVNLYYNPKTLWFDAGELDIKTGDGLVVSTARGTEFGRAAGEVFEADAAKVKRLKTPLKPVKRLATPEDEKRAAEMERKSREALPVFKEMVAETGADMRPVSVEYLLDGDKAVFYFEAEERVDFRELVRKLAARFHVRIDMRQIGVRDEARMVGGLGHCGQELCCKRLGGEFCPVSIRMAKEQDLSLNPQKISGVCGRLMCCLRYEFEAYKDFKSRAPKQNSTVDTPAGPAKVVDLDVPRETVSLKVEGEKPVRVPLADFEPPEEGSARPKAVGERAWEVASARTAAGAVGESSIFAASQLTGADKLADPGAVRRTGRGGQRPDGCGARGSAEGQQASGRKPRRRRSTKVGGEGASAEGEARKRAKQQKPQKQQGAAPAKGGQSSQQKKRSGSAGGKGRQQVRSSDAPKRQGQGASKQRTPQGASKQGGPRPGQRSSGLRQERAGRKPRPERQERQAGADEGHRRARRRSHKAGGSDAPGVGGAGEGA
ncbi:hypothetical protein B5F40_12865 [Gordonibacter sp. An230]|uniref:regulatory iron-sulfur-containing complex subunit RicT n=1 Tax=Gordonibacter sp. An230 TaxID=1965592 RepID=UPI000B371E2F|nr:regulatory iron-sulfur-containing complex subunit RicT [Gordonibacter sp. An230]OUO88031.1 hypothetical protein B5F40_12865 [Gordonibacter sp. An230]